MANTAPSKKPATNASGRKPVNTSATQPAAPAKKNNTAKIIVIIVVVVVAIFAILTLAGAWATKKVVEETTDGYTVNPDGRGVNITDGRGNEFSAGSRTTLPEGFPSHVPLYSRDIIAAGRTTIDGKTGWTVTVQTNDDLSAVSSGLRDAFNKDGWTIDMESTTNEGGFLTATKENLRVTAFYSTIDGKSSVLYTVAEE